LSKLDLFMKELLPMALRIERKLDLILERNKGTQMWKPMHWTGDSCPVCLRKVEYKRFQFPDGESLVTRICGCLPQIDSMPVQVAE